MITILVIEAGTTIRNAKIAHTNLMRVSDPVGGYSAACWSDMAAPRTEVFFSAVQGTADQRDRPQQQLPIPMQHTNGGARALGK
jgi:hypothetical protein